MTIHLSCGSIGVKADFRQALQYAHAFGFEAIDADGAYLATLSPAQLNELSQEMKALKVVWGTMPFPVEFRKSEAEYRDTLPLLAPRAAAVKRAGGTRCSTWLPPSHEEWSSREHFATFQRRLGECAKILKDNGLRFGLEYVGPKTLWSSRRYPFIHTMKETKELIAAIGTGNVGFVLDSWHWFTAKETVADLLTLTNNDIVSVDLNDAPLGRTVEEQIDSQRELPMATGVIDVKAFLEALVKIGCDAPVRCEPFNAPLRAMPAEQALSTTITAMKKAFALIGG